MRSDCRMFGTRRIHRFDPTTRNPQRTHVRFIYRMPITESQPSTVRHRDSLDLYRWTLCLFFGRCQQAEQCSCLALPVICWYPGSDIEVTSSTHPDQTHWSMFVDWMNGTWCPCPRWLYYACLVMLSGLSSLCSLLLFGGMFDSFNLSNHWLRWLHLVTTLCLASDRCDPLICHHWQHTVVAIIEDDMLCSPYVPCLALSSSALPLPSPGNPVRHPLFVSHLYLL